MTEFKNETAKHMTQYWLRNVEKQFLIFLGILVFFFLYQLILSDQVILEEEMQKIPYLVIGFGIMLLTVTAATLVRSSIPLAVAFGSTRIEAFYGYQMSNLVLALQIMISYILVEALVTQGKGVMSTGFICSFCCYFGGMLFALGLGEGFAIICTKLGPKGATFVIMIMIMVLVFSFGVLMAFISDEILDILIHNNKLAIASICLGGACYLIGSACNLKSIKTMTIVL